MSLVVTPYILSKFKNCGHEMIAAVPGHSLELTFGLNQPYIDGVTEEHVLGYREAARDEKFSLGPVTRLSADRVVATPSLFRLLTEVLGEAFYVFDEDEDYIESNM